MKRHVAVDTQGLPHVVAVATANVEVFDRWQSGLGHVERVLVDSAYTGKPFAQAVLQTLGATVQDGARRAGCAGIIRLSSCVPNAHISSATMRLTNTAHEPPP